VRLGARVIRADDAEHYQWGQGCDGWHLVRGEGLSVIEERMPPGAYEQRHFHERARQFFYVLDGELTMEIGGERLTVRTREGVEIAPGEAHQARNDSTTEVRFLVISSPPSHGDRVAAASEG
jgi:mannose-6-phosphate isomerase-like protein (cupin superfamily)